MLVVLVLLGCACGCVSRRMTIRSNPPGAHVYVDDYEIGATPVSHNFIYYGKRKIRLVKDGYETLTVMQSIPMPWYQIPPLDFVSENIVPGEIRDHRTITYQLAPQCVVPQDHLLARAEGLRNQVQAPRAMAPPPVMAPAGAGQPGIVNPLPGEGMAAPPAGNIWPQGTVPSPYPSQAQPQEPLGFGPRSAPPVQPVYPQPGYPQPTYTQPGTGGRMVQPVAPGVTGQ